MPITQYTAAFNGQPSRVNIIHVQVQQLGEATFSAVGEVVNTASRLQDHSKVVGARLVLSLDAARLAGVADALGMPEEVQVRGRSQPLQVLHVKQPSQLWGAPLGA